LEPPLDDAGEPLDDLVLAAPGDRAPGAAGFAAKQSVEPGAPFGGEAEERIVLDKRDRAAAPSAGPRLRFASAVLLRLACLVGSAVALISKIGLTT